MKGTRIIEAPAPQLKEIQALIKQSLEHIQVPEYVFSGIKGKSYVDHAALHIGKKFVYALDISAFFPSISREKVYFFFRHLLNTSPDVADVLASLTTIDLNLAESRDMTHIKEFLHSKGVRTMNHLISGSPASPIMSYLVNTQMFDELQAISVKSNILMTVYVDDIIFSSSELISKKLREQIRKIVSKFHYRISWSKERTYAKRYPKLITGVIIDKEGKLAVPNRLSQNIMMEFHRLKAEPENEVARRRLLGLVAAARQIDPVSFPSIRDFALRSLEH